MRLFLFSLVAFVGLPLTATAQHSQAPSFVDCFTNATAYGNETDARLYTTLTVVGNPFTTYKVKVWVDADASTPSECVKEVLVTTDANGEWTDSYIFSVTQGGAFDGSVPQATSFWDVEYEVYECLPLGWVLADTWGPEVIDIVWE